MRETSSAQSKVLFLEGKLTLELGNIIFLYKPIFDDEWARLWIFPNEVRGVWAG